MYLEITYRPVQEIEKCINIIYRMNISNNKYKSFPFFEHFKSYLKMGQF